MTEQPNKRLRVAVLASGSGTNFQALIDATEAGVLPVDLVGVFSDKPKSGAIERAKKHGLPHWSGRVKQFADKPAFEQALFDAVADSQPDLVFCLGYMRIISAKHTRAWFGKMLNLHPSLLPRYKGLHTHQRAIDDQASEHGCSIHLVSAELDDGPVLAQAKLTVAYPIEADDLGKQVQKLEHPLVLAVTKAWALGELNVCLADDEAVIQHQGMTLEHPLLFNKGHLVRE